VLSIAAYSFSPHLEQYFTVFTLPQHGSLPLQCGHTQYCLTTKKQNAEARGKRNPQVDFVPFAARRKNGGGFCARRRAETAICQKNYDRRLKSNEKPAKNGCNPYAKLVLSLTCEQARDQICMI
jgi:hypothetical protein